MRIFAAFLAVLTMFIVPAQSDEAPLLAGLVKEGKLRRPSGCPRSRAS